MSVSRTKKVFKYIVPTMLSNICFFLFTVVDGIFVGRGIGTNGLGAVNLITPFALAVGALNMLINMGGVTIFAIRLGKGDVDGANHVFRNGMALLGIVSVVLCALGVFATGSICTMLGAEKTFYGMAKEYLFWYSLFIIPNALSMGLQSYCRNDNAPMLVGAAVIISTAVNIFGDWLLIFPIPMGTKGAAIATGVSQTISLLIMLLHFVRRKGILRFGKLKLDGRLIGNILLHGLPEGLGQLCTPIVTMCMNIVIVNKIGDLGVNAFAVITYVASFTLAVFFGTSEGLQPLFGRSYGENNKKDLKFYFKAGLLTNLTGSALVITLIIALSRYICLLFGADSTTTDFVVKVLPSYAWGFLIMSFNVMISAYLYSTERSVRAIILNALRSVAVSSAVILLLPLIFGSAVIWYTFGIYETIVLVIAVVLLKTSKLKFKEKV